VREAQTDTLLRDLEIGALDAVVVAAPAEGAGLAAAVLFEDRFLLAASSARIAALGREVETLRPRALDPGQLLLLDEGHCLAGQALEVCAVDRRHTRVDLGASSLATLCGLVAEGFGLTFLPEIAMVAEQAAAPAMETLRFAAPEPARTIIAVRRASTEDDGWFTELAAILRSGGEDLVATARGRLPPKS
jgi:LysR family transcriptional regulator, hydrogen peroxide-inducible genes activator